MQCHSWDSKKKELRHYKRRHPESTPLYRIAYQERQNLEYQWEHQFQQTFGALRFEVLESIDKYLNCGILAHGCARIVCDTCKHSEVIAFSCKQRDICPSCAAKRALMFAEHLHTEVLKPVPHRHIVFSLPKRIRVFFKYDRNLGKILFKAAWETVLELYSIITPGAPGAVLVIQTSGESLNFNPHIHGIISSGTFHGDTFHESPPIDHHSLTELFTHKVLKALLRKELISQDNIDYLLSQSHTGFSVWMGERIDPADSSFRLFLSRYIDRGPVANSKIEINDDFVTYITEKDPKTYEFTPLEFLARITPHIPNKWEQTNRYFGAYSSRTRAVLKKKNTAEDTSLLIPCSLEPQAIKKASKSWAALIKQVFEVDPLSCPKCGSQMRVAGFITDSHQINRLLKNLNITPWATPLPILPNAPPAVPVLIPCDD